MKNKRPLFLWIGLLAIAIIVGLFYNHARSAAAASQVQYRTVAAQIGNVTDTVEASGVVQPLTTVDVKSRAGGRILKLAVDVGSLVKPGVLIAKIDPSDTLDAYNEAAADLATARAHLTQAEAQLEMQNSQDAVAVTQASASLASARVKLSQTQQQSQVQPSLDASAISQAKADLYAAKQQYTQMRDATQPQERAQAQSSYDQAKASVVAADAAYKRQDDLAAKGFVAAQSVEASLAARDVARATLAQAAQRLQTIGADQKAALAAADARVQQAQAALQTAQTNRVQTALRAQDVAAARSALRESQAGVVNAQAGMIQGRVRQSDIVAAQAEVSRAESAVKNRRSQLNDAAIYAPRTGVILQKYVEEGTIITSAVSLSSEGTNIVQLGDISQLFVDTSVDESDINRIRMGQKVNVALDALPGLTAEGRVTRIDPQAVNDRDVTNIHVRVQILHPDRQIKPGMNATCDFVLRDVRNVLVIPSDAVKEGRDGGNTVRVLTKDKQVQSRPVQVGVMGSDLTQIKSGLQVGDQVVLGIMQPSSPDGGGPGNKPGGGQGFGGGGPGGGHGLGGH